MAAAKLGPARDQPAVAACQPAQASPRPDLTVSPCTLSFACPYRHLQAGPGRVRGTREDRERVSVGSCGGAAGRRWPEGRGRRQPLCPCRRRAASAVCAHDARRLPSLVLSCSCAQLRALPLRAAVLHLWQQPARARAPEGGAGRAGGGRAGWCATVRAGHGPERCLLPLLPLPLLFCPAPFNMLARPFPSPVRPRSWWRW